MKDYRLPENRVEYFTALYKMNLQYGVMPGLVYLYMPELARRYNWDAEQKLWFAFLNGLTQNPITSLRLFDQLPVVPPAGAALTKFEEWFNAEWDTLQFDTDRRYQKKDTLPAIKRYAELIKEFKGSQEKMLTGTYATLWSHVRDSYFSFGRLSSFSYLEYVYLNGFGADCDDLLFSDKSGSKSHRNGMLLLRGSDELVWDKRLSNGQDGNYKNLKLMSGFLAKEADVFLEGFAALNPDVPNVGRFTMESNLCTFKNHFFGRRYPGVYADMAQERIEWADERGQKDYTAVLKDMRAELLPDWLRAECDGDRFTIKTNASVFPETGAPFRAEYFL
jgi:hypothetical protein